jgi:hypothetical protein
MTQRPIVAYLSSKGMSAREIHDDIVATLGPDAVSYSSVTRGLREARFPHSKPESHPADVQRDLDHSDQIISAALEDRQFASVRQLSRLTHLPSTTVYRRLTQSLGFVARHLRWVPHALSDAQKGERVNLSRRLLRMFEVRRDRAWHDIVVFDESRFYLSTIMNSSDYHEMKSSLKKTIHNSIEKFMLTVVWSPCGFHLIKILEKVASSTPTMISLRYQSHCPNDAQLKQRATGENCWCMRTMRARILPSYQLNISTRIE